LVFRVQEAAVKCQEMNAAFKLLCISDNAILSYGPYWNTKPSSICWWLYGSVSVSLVISTKPLMLYKWRFWHVVLKRVA